MTNNENLPETWCRMWSERPSLAHDLIADTGRQWASRTGGLDTIVGPEQAEAFIATYAVEVGNTFVVRTKVVGDEIVAYTWDLTLRDGTVKSGADFNVIQDGLVVDNWTFVDDARDQRTDPEGIGTADLEAVARADAERRGVRVHRTPAVDTRRQTVAYLWEPTSELPGGIDVLVLRDGAVAQTSSIRAERPFAY